MSSPSGYSPKVALSLRVNGQELALSSVGPAEVSVRDACEPIPPTNAELLITIDDETESYGIFLPHGIPNAPQTVSYI